MARQIQLNIAEPCSENWDKMDRTEKGRYCMACQKQVMDFTAMDEKQLALFFKHNTSQVCGRLRKDQLEKDLHIPRKRIHWFRYFVQVALPAIIVSNKGYTQGKVALRPVPVLLEQQKDSLKAKEAAIKPAAGYRMVSGRVMDTSGQAVAFATVWTPHSFEGTVCDTNGYFKLMIEKDELLAHVEVSSIGYVSRSVDLRLDTLKPNKVITLESVKMVPIFMGFVTDVPVKKNKKIKVQKEKTASKKLIQSFMDTVRTFFKVYPNPVSSGGSLNIELTGKLSEGYYSMEIRTIDGKSVYQKNELWIDDDARVLNIQIPVINAGSYILTLRSRKEGKTYSQQIMIKLAN